MPLTVEDRSDSPRREGSISWPNRLGTLPATSKHCILDLMKKYFLLIPLALGLVAFVPQKAQAGGYFSVSVGPAYCAPYPVYYGAYYPRYYRQYYYYDNPHGYWYWRNHRHWQHWHD